MSETEGTDAAKQAPVFSEKEQKHLLTAMLSLKSGPPEIDIAKFMKLGEFNTMKTAQNTWGKLKSKLKELSPASEKDGTVSPVTPKKTLGKKGSSKKRTTSADDDDDAEDKGSPSKKAKSTSKKATANGSVKKKAPKNGFKSANNAVESDDADTEDIKMEDAAAA